MSAADYVVPAAIAAHPAWFRLEGQRTYYSDRAAGYQSTYKRIKLGLIGLSASIPLLAFLPLPGDAGRWIVAGVGIAIALLEAVLLLNQYGPLWVKYRGTAESLKRERWLLLSRAGEYAALDDAAALRLLAERVEAVLDAEHHDWTEEQKQALAKLDDARRWLKEHDAQGDGAAAATGSSPAAGTPPGIAAVSSAAAQDADDPADAPVVPDPPPPADASGGIAPAGTPPVRQ